jgi:hypothetical protein
MDGAMTLALLTGDEPWLLLYVCLAAVVTVALVVAAWFIAWCFRRVFETDAMREERERDPWQAPGAAPRDPHPPQ